MQMHQVELMGRSFRIRSEDDGAHVRRVDESVNAQISELSGGKQNVAMQNATLLASLNMADELFKLRAEHDALKARIRSQTQVLLARLGGDESAERPSAH